MNEGFAVAAMALAAMSGVPGLFLDRRSAAGERIAAAALVLAAVLGVAGAIGALVAPGEGWRGAWSVPGGAIYFVVDGLSAWFLVPVLVVPALGSIYGLGYWRQVDHPGNGRRLRLFYGLLTAGLALLLCARHAVLFLFGWEAMALSGFFLVTAEDEDPAVRASGYVYLLATRLGTLALVLMFAVLQYQTGSLEFSRPPGGLAGGAATAVFLLALLGFGLKAGAMPLHVWLPGAHANAPSHVSAVMSGVLIKSGIYGLMRVATLADQPPAWWGLAVLVLGVVSGVLGVAFALGQHDIKRLLAYHSVENIGIILIGLGLALLGRTYDRPDLVLLGIAGALLHVWNHALFKALLFFAAGAVVHATSTREIDQLGGLLRRMPRSGLLFLVGAVAICGLPPLNGLASELLVYLGLLRGATSAPGELWLVGALAAPALAIIGALAVACFVKVFGIAFLGQPRSAAAAAAHEAGPFMLAPMAVLAAACFAIGLGSPLLAPALDEAAAAWAPAAMALPGVLATAPLSYLTLAGFALLFTVGLLGTWLARRTRGATRDVGTWDCGYAAPTPRMQYSSSSFADSLVQLFGWALRPVEERPHEQGLRPAAHAHYHSAVPEVVLDRVIVPAFERFGRLATRARWVQHPSVHVRLVYVLFGLLLLAALAR